MDEEYISIDLECYILSLITLLTKAQHFRHVINGPEYIEIPVRFSDQIIKDLGLFVPQPVHEIAPLLTAKAGS